MLTKIKVVRCSLTRAASRSYTCCQTSPDITASSGEGGSSIARSRSRMWPVSTIVHCALAPTRNFAISPIGFCVADKPIRTSSRPASACSRSSDSARCAPRLFGAIAWISSTITVRVVASILRPDALVNRMYSDSGVVTTICGGRRRIFSRSPCGVSPVRTTVRISTSGSPSRSSSARMPAMGNSRFF